MIFGVDFDGFGVGKDSLFVVLGREGSVSLLLPVLGGLLDVHMFKYFQHPPLPIYPPLKL